MGAIIVIAAVFGVLDGFRDYIIPLLKPLASGIPAKLKRTPAAFTPMTGVRILNHPWEGVQRVTLSDGRCIEWDADMRFAWE